MGLNIDYIDGQTPLEESEREGLKIKSISSVSELNQFEQYNIEKAIQWLMFKKIKGSEILTEKFIQNLHRRMFDDVWKWAGTFRKTNKNIGIGWEQIPVQLKQLLDDCIFWVENKTYSDEEICIRFKHRLVNIHCFPNGNGRHSRLMADLMMQKIYGKQIFNWNEGNLISTSDLRKKYISAIKLADNGKIDGLIQFAKS